MGYLYMSVGMVDGILDGKNTRYRECSLDILEDS